MTALKSLSDKNCNELRMEVVNLRQRLHDEELRSRMYLDQLNMVDERALEKRIKKNLKRVRCDLYAMVKDGRSKKTILSYVGQLLSYDSVYNYESMDLERSCRTAKGVQKKKKSLSADSDTRADN